MIPGFGRTNPDDEETAALEEAVARTLNALTSSELVDGTLLTGLDVTTSEEDFGHSLDRRVRGAIVVKQDAANNVWVLEADDPGQFVRLKASAATTVDLWVF